MREVVVVLGMGRSGTSLACQALDRLGVHFGGPLLPASENNPRGHYEHLEIQRIHREIMSDLGLQSWLFLGKLPSYWQTTDTAIRGKQLLREIIEKQRKPFAFKDLRTVRLLPMWQEIFRELGIKPLWVHCLRRPVEVHASISRAALLTNEFRARADEASVMKVWAENVSDAERVHPQLEIWFDYWFTRPQWVMDRLAAELGVECVDAEGLVDREMRHFG